MPRLVYLDVCALCRPFDDQQQVRIRLETDAVQLILTHVRQKNLKMITSPMHFTELMATTRSEERSQLLFLLNQLGTPFEFDLASTRSQANQLVNAGFGVADAAHVAFAQQANADFISVDDKLLRNCNRFGVAIWTGFPMAFCEKEGLA